MKKLVIAFGMLAGGSALLLSGARAEAYTARQEASINVARAYAYNTLHMTGFSVDCVTQDGTLVGATCVRTVTVGGRVTSTRYSVLFTIAAMPPPRGQTVGELYVARVNAVQLK